MSNISDYSNDLNMERLSIFLDEIVNVDYFYTRSVLFVFMCFTFAVCLIGNLLTCLVICCDKSLHTLPNYYMFNLAISDSVITLSVIIQSAGQQIFIQEYTDLMCQIQYFLVVTLWNGDMLTMMTLAIERYVAICHPFRLNTAGLRPKVMKKIILIWLTAIITSVPGVFTIRLIKTSRTVTCFVIPTLRDRIINGLLAVVTFIIPLTTMIVAYSMIIFKMNTRREEDVFDSTFNYRETKKKVNRFMAVIMFVFVVCWMPSFVTRMILSVLDVDQLLKLPKWFSVLFQVCMVNTWVSAISNPIFFCLSSMRFRRALKTFCETHILRNMINK